MLSTLNISNLNVGEKGYLIGIFVGDGYLHYDRGRHYRVNFYFNPKKDKDIIVYIIKLLETVGLTPYTMIHHGCMVIRVNSKRFYEYMKRFQYPHQRKNKDFMVGFISGLIDSDGYVKKGDIVISNKNKQLLRIVQLFCKQIDIKTTLWNQRSHCKGKTFIIWRLRIGTRFKYKQQYSRKILRIYGGGDCPP